MPRANNKKLVVCGSRVELYEYQVGVWTYDESEELFKIRRPGRDKTADDCKKIQNRINSLRVAKQTAARLIYANRTHNDKFLTFTFAENVTDLKKANYEWKKFRQRLEDYLDIKLRYLVVPEFQQRGAVHYHAYMFDFPYLHYSKLEEIWGQGYVDIHVIRKKEAAGHYVVKYMCKDLADERLVEQKCYFTSRNLNKPVVYYRQRGEQVIYEGEDVEIYELQDHTFDRFLDNCQFEFSREYEGEYCGKVKYSVGVLM